MSTTIKLCSKRMCFAFCFVCGMCRNVLCGVVWSLDCVQKKGADVVCTLNGLCCVCFLVCSGTGCAHNLSPRGGDVELPCCGVGHDVSCVASARDSWSRRPGHPPVCGDHGSEGGALTGGDEGVVIMSHSMDVGHGVGRNGCGCPCHAIDGRGHKSVVADDPESRSIMCDVVC